MSLKTTKKLHDYSSIESIVSEYYDVPAIAFNSSSRKEEFAHARFVLWYVLYTYTKLNSVKIGKLYKRDHTTILKGIRSAKVQKLYNRIDDATWSHLVSMIINK